MHQIEAHSSVSVGSDRSFGFVFAAVFTTVAAWPLLRGQDPRWTAFGLACAFALIALRRPELLTPLNQGWFKFALGLSRITTPIVMGLLFFAVVVPTGLIMRLCRKDLMSLNFDRDTPSYWVKRDPPGPPRDSMRNQF
jgi:Saxitoxin biosynthesis operon protein SxtJ